MGYGYQNKFQVRVGSDTGQCKTPPENTCIPGEVIHRHYGLEMCLQERINFLMATESFSIFIVWREFQINQFCLWGWQVPQLTIWLIRFGSGVEELIQYPYSLVRSKYPKVCWRRTPSNHFYLVGEKYLDWAISKLCLNYPLSVTALAKLHQDLQVSIKTGCSTYFSGRLS